MNTRRKLLWGGGLLVTFLIVIGTSLLFSPSLRASAGIPVCTGWFLDLPPAVADQCLRAKPTVLAVQIQNMNQTVQAIRQTPGIVPTPFVEKVLGTPVPTGFARPDAYDVKPLDKGDFAGMHVFSEATSLWQNGSVANPNGGEVLTLYVYALPGENDQARIVETIVSGVTPDDSQQFEKTWTAPRPIGTITITNITNGPKGIVSFRSSSGVNGQLNMATGTWSFTN